MATTTTVSLDPRVQAFLKGGPKKLIVARN